MKSSYVSLFQYIETLEAPIGGLRVKDIDGNFYKTVTIGSQVWMAENLRVTRYRNGHPIPKVSNPEVWKNSSIGALCSYDNNPVNADAYGFLYNWHAIADPQNICPRGWHIPSDEEWTTLELYLEEDGGKLKEAGTMHWRSHNAGATNESGFSGLPGGCRLSNGVFANMGNMGLWWSSDVIYDATYTYHRILHYANARFNQFFFIKSGGFSVRCIKD